jgi:type II secretory pathway component PulC
LPYININQETKEIFILPNIQLNEFFTNLKLQGGDILISINDKPYSMENIYNLLDESQNWKENEAIAIKIKRDGKEQIIKGIVKLPYEEKETLEVYDAEKSALKEAWLKG